MLQKPWASGSLLLMRFRSVSALCFIECSVKCTTLTSGLRQHSSDSLTQKHERTVWDEKRGVQGNARAWNRLWGKRRRSACHVCEYVYAWTQQEKQNKIKNKRQKKNKTPQERAKKQKYKKPTFSHLLELLQSPEGVAVTTTHSWIWTHLTSQVSRALPPEQACVCLAAASGGQILLVSPSVS